MPGVLKRQDSQSSSDYASSSTAESSSSSDGASSSTVGPSSSFVASSATAFSSEAATATSSSTGSVGSNTVSGSTVSSSTISDGQVSTTSNPAPLASSPTSTLPSSSAPQSTSSFSAVPTSANPANAFIPSSSSRPSLPSTSSIQLRISTLAPTPSPAQPSSTTPTQTNVAQRVATSPQPSDSETSSSVALAPTSSSLSVVSFTLGPPITLSSTSLVDLPLSLTGTLLPTSTSTLGTGSASGTDTSVDASHATSRKPQLAAVIGTTTTFGGLALIAIIGYLVFWCRTHHKRSASIRSAQAPLWHQGGGLRPSGSLSSSRASTSHLRPGHSSGMDMVQVSRDPFAASSHGHESNLRVETPSLASPAPLLPAVALPKGGDDQKAYEGTQLSGHLKEWSIHSLPPPYPAGILDAPIIRVSTATAEAEADGSSPWGRESMFPLETPEDERYIRNPFVDPDYMTSTSTLGTVHIDEAYGGVVRERTVDSMVVQPVSSRHLTLTSLRVDYVNGVSPVDQIDRFWDITEQGAGERKPPPPSGSPSSEVLLRSVSPGPLSGGLNSRFPTPT